MTGFLYFFDNDRLTKNNKKCRYQMPPPKVVVVTVSFFPFQHPAIFAVIYSQAAHLEGGFGEGEIELTRKTETRLCGAVVAGERICDGEYTL